VLFRRKERGEKPVEAEPAPPASNVINLMDALQKSLKKSGASSAKASTHRATAPAKRKARR
jgi:non-homologous end joining protein Ku